MITISLDNISSISIDDDFISAYADNNTLSIYGNVKSLSQTIKIESTIGYQHDLISTSEILVIDPYSDYIRRIQLSDITEYIMDEMSYMLSNKISTKHQNSELDDLWTGIVSKMTEYLIANKMIGNE